MKKAITHSVLSVILFLSFTEAFAGTKKEEAPSESQPAAPEIKKIDTFEFSQGERLFRSPLSLVRDEKNGDLIVTSFEANEVVILDKNGTLIKRIGPESGIVSPYGAAIDKNGVIYISEVQTGLLKAFGPSGLLTDEINLSKLLGRIVSPGRITISKTGFLFIVDLNDKRLLVLNGKGDYEKTIGNFEYLQKAAEIGGGKVAAVSAMGKTMSIFNDAGDLVNSFGGHTGKDENFSFPTGFAVDSKNRIWIADAFQHRLRVFSLEGKQLFNFGRVGKKSSDFFFPVDLCFGRSGELFVLEKGAERIQVFQVSDLKASKE